MSRVKLAFAVLAAVILLTCGPAEAQELNLQGRPLGLEGFATIGISGGSSYKLNLSGNVGVRRNTKRTQTELTLGGNNSSKKQGETQSFGASARAQYALSKTFSLGGGASYGCLEGEIARCLIALELFSCLGSWEQGVCVGPVATLGDSHDFVAARLTWAKEFRQSNHIVLDIVFGVSRLQGVAGLPGYRSDGMSEDFAATYRYGLFYQKSW